MESANLSSLPDPDDLDRLLRASAGPVLPDNGFTRGVLRELSKTRRGTAARWIAATLDSISGLAIDLLALIPVADEF